MSRQPITQQGHQKVQQELKTMRQVELPKNVRAIEEARAHGDLSENAEYHAAKERNAIIAAKICELEEVLATCEVIDPLPVPNGKVVFGATITLLDLETDEELTYRLVGPPEADASAGSISLTSPIGQALVGKEEGDEIRVKTPGGMRLLEVVAVK